MFLIGGITPSPLLAQTALITGLNLPQAGNMVATSPVFNPPIISGMTVHPDKPFQFDFIIDTGDDHLKGIELHKESQKLINYFMAALTVPENELWVNLSPYEENRIIADGLSKTEMGRDMLAQDYLLKQLTASLMYPEEELGEKFWNRIYQKAESMYGTAKIPTNTFNKIWIVPSRATIYANDNNVFVTESYLKVMLEEDYLSLEANIGHNKHGLGNMTKETIKEIGDISKDVVREVLIPEIEKEVNNGKNFANLRQIYNSMLLATWYKRNLKESWLSKVYANQNKVDGIDTAQEGVKEKIYNQYVEAFEKGVYNYIREDIDRTTQKMIPRKYFSGGLAGYDNESASPINIVKTPQSLMDFLRRKGERDHVNVSVAAPELESDENQAVVISGLDSLNTDVNQIVQIAVTVLRDAHELNHQAHKRYHQVLNSSRGDRFIASTDETLKAVIASRNKTMRSAWKRLENAIQHVSNMGYHDHVRSMESYILDIQLKLADSSSGLTDVMQQSSRDLGYVDGYVDVVYETNFNEHAAASPIQVVESDGIDPLQLGKDNWNQALALYFRDYLNTDLSIDERNAFLKYMREAINSFRTAAEKGILPDLETYEMLAEWFSKSGKTIETEPNFYLPTTFLMRKARSHMLSNQNEEALEIFKLILRDANFELIALFDEKEKEIGASPISNVHRSSPAFNIGMRLFRKFFPNYDINLNFAYKAISAEEPETYARMISSFERSVKNGLLDNTDMPLSDRVFALHALAYDAMTNRDAPKAFNIFYEFDANDYRVDRFETALIYNRNRDLLKEAGNYYLQVMQLIDSDYDGMELTSSIMRAGDQDILLQLIAVEEILISMEDDPNNDLLSRRLKNEEETLKAMFDYENEVLDGDDAAKAELISRLLKKELDIDVASDENTANPPKKKLILDKALKITSSPIQEVGGIDLNPNNIQLNETGETIEFNLPDINNFPDANSINGIVPVIINITPISSLPLLIGMNDSEADELSYISE